jgi:hypothetical protein
MRTVKTTSAVQIVLRHARRADIEHIGSAQDTFGAMSSSLPGSLLDCSPAGAVLDQWLEVGGDLKPVGLERVGREGGQVDAPAVQLAVALPAEM